MKKSKYTESQIIKAIKENGGGCSVAQISREISASMGTFYT
jgi:putative transposase